MRIAFLPALVFGLVAVPGTVFAQPNVKTEFQPVVKDDLRHGQVLEITPKGGNKITGTLVRVDGDRLFVCTQSGALPQAVARKDAEIKKEVQYKVSKDNVKLVGSESDVIEPEIQAVEIVNGNKRTVRYQSSTLSSGERSMLQNLQSAENEMAELQYLQDRQQIVMENTIAMQTEQRRSLELQNRYMDWMNMYLRRQDPITDYWTSSWGRNPWGQGYYNWPQGNIATPYTGQFQGIMPVIQQGAMVTPNIVIQPEALSKARQNLATAQNAAVFERNRLVAVVVTDK